MSDLRPAMPLAELVDGQTEILTRQRSPSETRRECDSYPHLQNTKHSSVHKIEDQDILPVPDSTAHPLSLVIAVSGSNQMSGQRVAAVQEDSSAIENFLEPAIQLSSENTISEASSSQVITPAPNIQQAQPQQSQVSADGPISAHRPPIANEARQAFERMVAHAMRLPDLERRAALESVETQMRQVHESLNLPMTLFMCYHCLKPRRTSDFPEEDIPGLRLCVWHASRFFLKLDESEFIQNPETGRWEYRDQGSESDSDWDGLR